MKNNSSTNLTWGIKRRKDFRFEIYDTSTNQFIDDANGHGFTSYIKAYNYGFNQVGNSGMCTGSPNIDELGTQTLFKTNIVRLWEKLQEQFRRANSH